MLGKYLLTFEDSNKILCCSSSELKEKTKKLFNISQTFFFQMFDDDFQVWVDLDDLDALPLKAKLKVIVKGKWIQQLCDMHAIKRYRLFV